MIKKWKIVAVVTVVAVMAAIFVRHFNSEKADGGTAKVTTEGGTFGFPSGLSVVVPKGAVDGDATLKVSKPSVLDKSASGPLTGIRTAGIVFDVALIRGGNDPLPI